MLMRRIGWIIVNTTIALVCMSVLAFCQPVSDINSHRVAEKALKSSVLIRIKGIMLSDKDKRFHRVMIGCSGTYVSQDMVLTAAHCVSGYVPVFTWVRDYHSLSGVRANIILVDAEHDLALLQTKGTKHVYARIGYSPRIGDPVINIGSPSPFEFLVTQGVVALKVPGMLFTTAFIDHGSSGGGCFDRHGRLVGVNIWKILDGIAGAVNVHDIVEFLARAK